jgi:hypothetical protein
MKKLGTAVILCMWLLFSLSCSSTPSGTMSIGDIQSKGTEKLGQNVVVVGLAETGSVMSSFRMFRVYDGGDFLWVVFPESVVMPPQGAKVRVTGLVQQKEFTGIGKTLYIDATKVMME